MPPRIREDPFVSTVDPIEERAVSLPAAGVVRRPSFDEACALAAARTSALLAEAVAERGSGHLALTGGSAGVALARVLPAALGAAGIGPGEGLESIHLWFGDERFAPPVSPTATTCWRRIW